MSVTSDIALLIIFPKNLFNATKKKKNTKKITHDDIPLRFHVFFFFLFPTDYISLSANTIIIYIPYTRIIIALPRQLHA